MKGDNVPVNKMLLLWFSSLLLLKSITHHHNLLPTTHQEKFWLYFFFADLLRCLKETTHIFTKNSCHTDVNNKGTQQDKWVTGCNRKQLIYSVIVPEVFLFWGHQNKLLYCLGEGHWKSDSHPVRIQDSGPDSSLSQRTLSRCCKLPDFETNMWPRGHQGFNITRLWHGPYQIYMVSQNSHNTPVAANYIHGFQTKSGFRGAEEQIPAWVGNCSPPTNVDFMTGLRGMHCPLMRLWRVNVVVLQ